MVDPILNMGDQVALRTSHALLDITTPTMTGWFFVAPTIPQGKAY